MSTLSPHADTGNIPTTSGIYKITCVANQKMYRGSTENLRGRRNDHFNTLRRNKHHNPKLQAAWNKYGEESLTFEVLELVLPLSLRAREQYWFKKLNPFGRKGFNIARDAEAPPNVRGIKRSSAFRENLRTRMLGNSMGLGRKRPRDAVEKTRQANLGKKRSLEAIEHMRQNRWVKRADRTVSSETRKRMSKAHTGQKHTPEALEKMRKAQLGNKHGLGKGIHHSKKHSPEKVVRSRSQFGHKHTMATIEKIRQAKSTPEAIEKNRQVHLGRKRPPETLERMSKSIIVTSPDGTEQVVHGINQFCREHNLDASCLVKVAKGKYSQHKGWKARYPSEGGETWSL